jgi:hypothetical protein
MIIIITVLAILLAAIVIVAVKEASKDKIIQTKCGCGKSVSGYCDGSHNNTAEKTEEN